MIIKLSADAYQIKKIKSHAYFTTIAKFPLARNIKIIKPYAAVDNNCYRTRPKVFIDIHASEAIRV